MFSYRLPILLCNRFHPEQSRSTNNPDYTHTNSRPLPVFGNPTNTFGIKFDQLVQDSLKIYEV